MERVPSTPSAGDAKRLQIRLSAVSGSENVSLWSDNDEVSSLKLD